MDALGHNLEAFCAPFYHPMADGIALEGMRLIKEWLPVAVREPDNIEARAHMMVASSMGATAFQKGLGAMQSLSHPCSALFHTHHGLTNAVVMPYVLVWNRSAIEDKLTAARPLSRPREARLPRGARLGARPARDDRDPEHAVGDRGHGRPRRQMAPMAEQDPSTGGNPVPMTEQDSSGST